MEKGVINGKYLMYQGKPLIRQDNALVWGDMNDRAVLALFILSTKAVEVKAEDGTVTKQEIPDNILIRVLSTDDQHQVLKQGQKNGLFTALDLGIVWLKRELGE